MTDFSTYTAENITDWLFQGADMPSAPASVYVTLFDDTDTELDSDLQNGRVETTAGTDWNYGSDNDEVENAAEVNFGEATSDLTNVQDVALYDAGSLGNELARYTLTDAPFDVSTGTRVFFAAGELSFDVQDE